MKLATTCCVCATPMGGPEDNEHWPCCTHECEGTYIDIQWEMQQREDNLRYSKDERDYGTIKYGDELM